MRFHFFPMFRQLLAVAVGLGISAAVGARSGVTHFRDSTYRWKSVSIVAGGFISGIDYHPGQKDLVYLRTDIGGAYRWDVKQSRWIPLLDWLKNEDWNLYGIESIGLDPSNPNKLYRACGTYTNDWGGNGAILRSNDQGRSFRRTNLPFKLGGNEDGRSIGERLAVDPNDGLVLYFGTRHNGLWASPDAGVSWSQVSSFPIKERTNGIGTCVVAFDPSSGRRGQPSKTIYVTEASLKTSLYRSTDGGATWSPVEGGPSGMYPHHMLLTSSGDLVITYSNGPGPNGISNGAVWKLNPRSGSWSDITPIKPNRGGEAGFGYAGLAIDPKNPNAMVVSTLDRWQLGDDVFRTADGGKTWTGLKNGSSRDCGAAPYMTWGRDSASFGWWIGAVGMDPFHPSTVLYGTGANLWGSDDTAQALKTGFSHWTIRGEGIEETADIELLSPPEGPHLISGLGDIGGFTHLDLDKPAPGMTMHPLLNNTDSLDFAYPDWVVRVGRGGGPVNGGYSKDAGVTWKMFPTGPSKQSGGSVAISRDGPTIVWSPEGTGPSRSIDLGKTWTPCLGVTSQAQIVCDRVDATTFYAIARGAVYVSHDSGTSFAKEDATGLRGSDGLVRAAPDHKADLWAPSGQGLFRSTDGGNSFFAIAGVDAAQSVGFGKAAPGHESPAVFINGKVDGTTGVFRSDDAGLSWVRITDARHEYGVRNIVIGDPRIFGRVYLGTNGRGVLYGDPVQ
jgi:hypothetical protein